jgi:hypothetical protein
MWLVISCLSKHTVGGIGAARIGQDRLKMDSKSPKSGRPHKNSFFNVPSFCVSLYRRPNFQMPSKPPLHYCPLLLFSIACVLA